jgi:hypothetical protein
MNKIKRYAMDWEYEGDSNWGIPLSPHIYSKEIPEGRWVKYEDVEQIIKNEQRRKELIEKYKEIVEADKGIGYYESSKLQALEECEVEDATKI